MTNMDLGFVMVWLGMITVGYVIGFLRSTADTSFDLFLDGCKSGTGTGLISALPMAFLYLCARVIG